MFQCVLSTVFGPGHNFLKSQKSLGPLSLFLRRYFFTLNILTGAVIFNHFTLMVVSHISITVRTTRLLWRQRDILQARREKSRSILRDRGTSEHLLLWGFNFTFSNLNVFPYPLRQRRQEEGRATRIPNLVGILVEGLREFL